MKAKLDSVARKDKRYWQNLTLAGGLAFYLAQVIWLATTVEFTTYLGGDFRAFWSAEKIALSEGFGSVYDLNRLKYVQAQMASADESNYYPAPAAFLPVFQNFYWGQVNVWFVLVAGEFFIALARKQELKAGLLLGGLLLKPQLLVVILPLLLIERRLRILLGFALAAFPLVLLSVLLAGTAGLISLFDLWTKFSVGIPTNAPEKMMNWRMVAIHLGNLFSPSIGYSVAALAILITFYCTAKLWLKHPTPSLPQVGLKMLAGFAATRK